MELFENTPPPGLEQLGRGVDPVYSGVPGVRVGHNPFEQPSFTERDEKTTDWQERSLCAQVDSELFFSNKGGDTVRAAKKICQQCTELSLCRPDTIESDMKVPNDEIYGVRGGLSANQRIAIKRQNNRKSK